MIITLLLALLIVSSVMQGNIDRFKVASIYSFIIVISDYIISDFGGSSYFLMDGLTNLFILIALSNLVVVSNLARSLSIVCLLSVFVNFVGWMMWENYLLPEAYNFMFVVIYSYAIIVMLKPEPQDVGNNTNNNDCPGIHCTFTEQLEYSFKDKG